MALCLFVSLIAHAGVAAALSQPRPAREEEPAVFEVSIVSLAAPAAALQAIEPAAGDVKTPAAPAPVKAAAPEKQAEKKPPEQKTAETSEASNDSGRDVSTVIPVVRDLQTVRQTPPEYPSRARKMGQQGEVLLRALVDETGRPRDLRVAISSGHDSLDRSALAAVRGWQFRPASREGRSFTVWAEIPVRFVLR